MGIIYLKRKKKQRSFRQFKRVKVRAWRIKTDKKHYHETYLKSDHWKEVQTVLYGRYKQCRLCSSSIRLNIHHITYTRLGNERLSDLIVLCENCHINIVHEGLVTKEQLFLITGGSEEYFREVLTRIKRPKKKKKNQYKSNPLTAEQIHNIREKQMLKKMGTIAYYQKKALG